MMITVFIHSRGAEYEYMISTGDSVYICYITKYTILLHWYWQYTGLQLISSFDKKSWTWSWSRTKKSCLGLGLEMQGLGLGLGLDKKSYLQDCYTRHSFSSCCLL